MKIALLIVAGMALAQQPDAVFRSQTREVLLEVVVRDLHGRPMTKLNPSDLSIFEDGVKQEVVSFRFVPGREARAEAEHIAPAPAPSPAGTTPAPATRPTTNPLRTVNVVCLVMNDLTPDTRGFAFKAARKFVDQQLRPDTFIGVFSLDAAGLRPVFPFSNKRENLVKAIELASVNQLPSMTQGAGAVFNGLSIADPNFALSPSTNASGGLPVGAGQGVLAGIPGDPDPLSTLRGNIESANMAGLREVENLQALVKQLSSLPFQKTVLLFSGGLTRPSDWMERWYDLIKAANKGGVTFYGFDVNGLCPDQSCASSPTAVASALLTTSAQTSASQSTVGLFPRGPRAPGGSSLPGGSPTQQLMNASHEFDVLRHGVLSGDVQEALREIAESTGGFLIATNNTDGMLAKVMDEVDTHFEISYRPTASANDGRYRKVEVKLARANYRAETRRGYYAMPDTDSLQPGDYAALAAIEAKPHSFDFLARSFRFGPERYAIAWEVPLSALHSTPDPEKGARKFHAYLMALIKNSQGDVVERVSKEVAAEPDERVLASIAGEPMVYEHAVNLAPGHYTVEAAVVDEEGNQSSTASFSIDGNAESFPALSDIILVRRVNPVNRLPDPTDPFEMAGKRAQPYLANTVAANAKPYVYFVAYPDAKGSDATLRVRFSKNGRVLATQNSPLRPANENGAVQMAIAPPGGPGNYEVTVRVTQGGHSTERVLKYTSGAQ